MTSFLKLNDFDLKKYPLYERFVICILNYRTLQNLNDPNPNKESTTLIPICSDIKCFDTWVSPRIGDLCEIEIEEMIIQEHKNLYGSSLGMCE